MMRYCSFYCLGLLFIIFPSKCVFHAFFNDDNMDIMLEAFKNEGNQEGAIVNFNDCSDKQNELEENEKK